MVEEVVKTCHVAYERDKSGWWVASVRELRGCHTQGRTVDEARRRIVEAMELFIDNARSAQTVDDVKLPVRASAQQWRLAEPFGCCRLRMSARDAARLLGLSHQRERRILPMEAPVFLITRKTVAFGESAI